jgi:hypothetical protein
MSLSAIRAEIKSKLESVTGIGQVQDYRRHTIDWNEIATLFKSGSKINGWIIDWTSAPQTKEASGSIILNRRHTFRVWGLYSLKDNVASAKTFDDLVEAILNEFSKDQDLIQYVRWPDDAPPGIVAMDEQMFTGVLCHRAQLALVYEEQVEPS